MLQTAVIAQRTDSGEPDTTEISDLTEAAGARVVGEVTQVRHEDPSTGLGAGKLTELAELVEETGADTVVVDGGLTPGQTVNVEQAVGVAVLDRHRVVLEIFASQAGSRRSQLQVELARLRYELPRARERADEGLMNRWAEKGTRYYDIEDRIDELERRLADLPADGGAVRERRRDQGFDLVALAGYTNAGKSTLLRRLADDMSLETDRHPDLAETATAADRLFETLETTRRRATIQGRKTLLTDTVGFLADLPHWLVDSFRGTLDAVEGADAVVLVVDIAQSQADLRDKLQTVFGAIGADHPPVVPVLNKADLVDDRTCAARTRFVSSLLRDWRGRTEHQTAATGTAPVVISAREDEALVALRDRIASALPALERERLSVPTTDDGFALVSWIHDNAANVDVSYGAEMTVEIEARPCILAKATAKAESVRPDG